MKIKPAVKSGGVVMELGAGETQLPRTAGEEATQALPVFKLKKILVPVDFSQCTEEALLYAVPFARQFDAELMLLHVLEPAYLPASEMDALPETESTGGAMKDLQELRDKLPGEVRCNVFLRRGSAPYEIIAAAQELDGDMIILSTHGRTGLERLVMGSTAGKVVRRAGCPVLIVRENEHEFVTGSEASSPAAAATTRIETDMITGL